MLDLDSRKIMTEFNLVEQDMQSNICLYGGGGSGGDGGGGGGGSGLGWIEIIRKTGFDHYRGIYNNSKK